MEAPKQREKWREELILNNLGLVYDCVRQFASFHRGRQHDCDDLIGEGMKVLVVQADRYDSEHPSQAEFQTYAYRAIKSRMGRVVRRWRKIRSKEVQCLLLEDDRGDQHLACGDVSIDEPPDDYGVALKNWIESALSCLDEQESEAVRLRYLEQKTLREVSEVVGVSLQMVSHRVKKALKKMRRYAGHDADIF